MKAILLSLFGFLLGWHGQLLIAVEQNRFEEVKKAAFAALDQWEECGYDAPYAVKIVSNDLNPEGIHKGNPIVCAQGQMNGTMIWLDSRSWLFGDNSVCGTYKNVIGHEIAHLMGFGHDAGEDEAKAFYLRLKICGFTPQNQLHPVRFKLVP